MSEPVGLKDGRGDPIVTTKLDSIKALTKEEIEALVKKVSESAIKDVIKKVEDIPEDDISAMNYGIFDFIGFNPLTIIAVIKIIADHYSDPEKVMLSDVRFCVAACLYMGNIQSKAMSKRSAEGRAKLEFLAQKYGIMMGTTMSGQSAETLTFPRVAASYPVLAIRMAKSIPPKAVNLEFKSGLIPGYMRLTPFASLCSPLMKEEARVFMMEACNAHGSDMAIAYEKGRLKKAKKEIKYDVQSLANDQWSFVEIASASPVPEEGSKKNLLSKLNVVADYKNLAEVVINYRAIMQKKKTEEISVMSQKEFEEQLTSYLSS
jgi:hypothetical protein